MDAKKPCSERMMVFAAIALGPILLIGPILVRGEALFWGTPGLQFIPWWAEAWRQLQMGLLPLWNNLNGMGAPLLANYQMAFFYPPNWILLVFAKFFGTPGIAWGYTFLAMLHLIWAGWGMAVLLRRLGVGPLAQVIGGLAFGLSGYVVARLGFFSMIWVTAWMPWIIRYADEISNPGDANQKVVLQPWLILCLGLQYMAGHAQLAWYSTLLMCAWVVVGVIRRKQFKRLGWAIASLAITGLAAGLIAAVQLLPTAEYLSQSQRATEYGYEDAMVYSFWPWRLITLVAPSFFGNPANGDYWGYATYWEDAAYIGMLPLIFALSTLGWFFRKNSLYHTTQDKRGLIGALWGLVGISVLLALGKNTPVFPLLYRYIPTFALFQAPARYMLWGVFGLCILSAFGIDQWKSPNRRQRDTIRGYTVAALAVMIGSAAAWLSFRSVHLTFVTATALAGFWATGTGVFALTLASAERKRRKAWWSAGIVIWVMLDLLIADMGLNPGVATDFYAVSNSEKAALVKTLGGNRVYLGAQDEFTLKFKRFLRVSDYTKLEDWKEIRAVGLPNTNLFDQVAMANNFDPFVPGRYQEWINLLEKSTAARRDSLLKWMGVQLVEVVDASQPHGVRFDTTLGALRYGWFTCAQSVKNAKDALDALEASDVLVLEQAGGGPNSACMTDHTVPGSVRAENPEFVDIEINAKMDGWIYVANTWYPGWNATLDGNPVQLYRANYLFQAVYIPKGNHILQLRYQPKTFYIGAIFSILISVVMMSYFFARHILGKRSSLSTNVIRNETLE